MVNEVHVREACWIALSEWKHAVTFVSPQFEYIFAAVNSPFLVETRIQVSSTMHERFCIFV